jgi:hypothetical protein
VGSNENRRYLSMTAMTDRPHLRKQLPHPSVHTREMNAPMTRGRHFESKDSMSSFDICCLSHGRLPPTLVGDDLVTILDPRWRMNALDLHLQHPLVYSRALRVPCSPPLASHLGWNPQQMTSRRSYTRVTWSCPKTRCGSWPLHWVFFALSPHP